MNTKTKNWNVSNYRLAKFERLYIDLYVLNRMTRYKKYMRKEDALMLDGLCARKYAFYQQLYDYDKTKKDELFEWAKNDLLDDIEEISLGKLKGNN